MITNSQSNHFQMIQPPLFLLFLLVLVPSIASNISKKVNSSDLPQNVLMNTNLMGSTGSGDQVGIALATNGNVMAVGAGKGRGHGQVHMYDFNGLDWVFSQTLVSQDATYGDFFGTALALTDEKLIVGAYHDDVFNVYGAAYVFQRVNGIWQQTQRIQAAQPRYESHYGQSIVANGDWLFISAKNQSQDGIAQSGIVEVYQWNNGIYQLQNTLYPQTAQFTANFGAGLAVDDNWLMVGAVEAGDDDLGEDTFGRVFVYSLIDGQWVYQYKLGPQEPFAGRMFGYDLELDSGRLAVSSPIWNGSVTLFKLSDGLWTFEEKIISNEDDDWYAYDLELDGDNLYVGSLRTNGRFHPRAGAVFHYQFETGAWNEVQKINSIAERYNGAFGSQVKLIDGKLMVGGVSENGVSLSSGAVNVFINSNGIWEGQNQLDLPSGAADRYLGMQFSVFDNEIMSTQAVVGGNQRLFGVLAHKLDNQTWEQSSPINEPSQIPSHQLDEIKIAHNETFMALSLPIQNEVFIYQKLNELWDFQQSITSPIANNDEFGKSISLLNNQLAIGSNKGVFVYEENSGWAYQSTVWETSTNSRDFATQIKLSDDRILILGKRYDNGSLSDAVLFDYSWIEDQWIEQAVVNDESTHSNEDFGSRFDWVDNNLVLVSDANVNSTTFFGAIYTYKNIDGQWLKQNVLYSDPIDEHVEFAKSIVLDMPFLYIGSPDAIFQDKPYGRVSVYRNTLNGWSHVQNIHRNQSNYFQEFGRQLSLLDQTLVVGVPRANNQGTDSGAIQLIDVSSLELIFKNGLDGSQ